MSLVIYRCRTGYLLIPDILKLPHAAETEFGPATRCAALQPVYENLPETWERVFDEFESRSFAMISVVEHGAIFSADRTSDASPPVRWAEWFESGVQTTQRRSA